MKRKIQSNLLSFKKKKKHFETISQRKVRSEVNKKNKIKKKNNPTRFIFIRFQMITSLLRKKKLQTKYLKRNEGEKILNNH